MLAEEVHAYIEKYCKRNFIYLPDKLPIILEYGVYHTVLEGADVEQGREPTHDVEWWSAAENSPKSQQQSPDPSTHSQPSPH